MLTIRHNIWKSEINEIVRSLSFWIGSAVTAILMGTQGFVAKDEHAYSMRNIWEVLLFEKKFPKDNTFQTLISTGHLGVYTYFIPLLASFCYLAFQVQYHGFGFERAVKIRLPKKSYHRSTYLSALFVGGITLAAGHFIYVIMVGVLAGIRFGLLVDWSCFLYIMQTAIEAFLAGMFWNSVVYVLLHFIRNIYLLGTLPFLLKYIWGCVQHFIWLNYPETSFQYRDMFNFFDDDGIYFIFSMGVKGGIIVGLLTLVLLLNYYVSGLLERRRIDYGSW